MSDTVERLRWIARGWSGPLHDVATLAATEIDRLRRDLATERELTRVLKERLDMAEDDADRLAGYLDECMYAHNNCDCLACEALAAHRQRVGQ